MPPAPPQARRRGSRDVSVFRPPHAPSTPLFQDESFLREPSLEGGRPAQFDDTFQPLIFSRSGPSSAEFAADFLRYLNVPIALAISRLSVSRISPSQNAMLRER